MDANDQNKWVEDGARDAVKPDGSATADAGWTPEESATDSSAFRRLDPRVIGLWRLANALAIGALGLPTAVAGIGLWLFTGLPKPIPLAMWSLILGGFLLGVWWYPPRKFARWRYRVDAHVIEIRYGLCWRTSVLIPASRVQHVDTHRSPLERRLGLARLSVHTAGTRNAAHEVPGLEAAEATRLRDELLAAAHRTTEPQAESGTNG